MVASCTGIKLGPALFALRRGNQPLREEGQHDGRLRDEFMSQRGAYLRLLGDGIADHKDDVSLEMSGGRCAVGRFQNLLQFRTIHAQPRYFFGSNFNAAELMQ